MTQTIIFNNDGSIKYKNLAGFVTQGSNNVDSLEVAVDGYTSDDYTASFYFTLPNDEIIVLQGTPGTVEGQSGYTVLLTSAVTSIAGNDRVSVKLLDTNDDVLFTYPFVLVINPTSATPDITLISYSQYASLESSLSSMQPKYSASNVRSYAGVSSVMQDITNLATGQVFYILDRKAWAYKNDGGNLEIIPEALPVTYSSLSYMAANGLLMQGAQYRLTDYVATTSTENTASANHRFDLILTADSPSTLNENARAVLHYGDSHFAGCDLGAWEIKYSLSNDEDRFDWADENGKGVIYYMKDEWGNSAFYDFKGILFSKEDEYISVYTFNYYSGGNKDASIDPSKHCVNNKLGQYNIKTTGSVYSLPFIIFIDASDCYGNEFDCDCQNIMIGTACPSNKFGRYCRAIYLDSVCSNNEFKVDCHDVNILSYCHNNGFGNSCHHIELGEQCTGNTFGNSCSYISLGDYGNYNTFGPKCTDISFEHTNTLIDYVQYCEFGEDCHYIKLFSPTDYEAGANNQIQYLKVDAGTSGVSSLVKIQLVLNRNLPFAVRYSHASDRGHFSTDCKAVIIADSSDRLLGEEDDASEILALQLFSVDCFENVIIADDDYRRFQFAGCQYDDHYQITEEAYYQTAIYLDDSQPACDSVRLYQDDGYWYISGISHHDL